MKDRSLFSRFVTAARDFGPGVAMRVAFSKVRGWFVPAMALPDEPDYDRPPRELSILIDAAEQDAATLQAIVKVLDERGGQHWEICVCDRPAKAPEMERTLSRLRGAKPWIRVVSADGSTDDATAAQWTVEQCTGEFVAVLARGQLVDAGAIDGLLASLRNDSGMGAVMLDGGAAASGRGPERRRSGSCGLVLQKKSAYLAAAPGRWPLTAPALAKALDEAGARSGIVAAPRIEAN